MSAYWKPDSWLQLVGGLLLLLGGIAVLAWITLGIIYVYNHPESAIDSERSDFVRSCDGVADTHTNNWTCRPTGGDSE